MNAKRWWNLIVLYQGIRPVAQHTLLFPLSSSTPKRGGGSRENIITYKRLKIFFLDTIHRGKNNTHQDIFSNFNIKK